MIWLTFGSRLQIGSLLIINNGLLTPSQLIASIKNEAAVLNASLGITVPLPVTQIGNPNVVFICITKVGILLRLFQSSNISGTTRNIAIK